MYVTEITSPVGGILLSSDGLALTGLWLKGQKYFAATLDRDTVEQPDLPVFRQTAVWLDAYFTKSPLPALPPLAPKGSSFRQAVWKLLLEIPHGKTTTYGELTRKLRESGIPAAPQAVGGAVGHNPISILIPCHRVLGADGSLTGYAGGVEKKRFLLQLESPANSGYPCPCCGCRTFPVPAADALAYICPVCMWENDLFTTSDDEPSDENHGLTLNQGRENFKTLGVCDSRLARYARKPSPGEL